MSKVELAKEGGRSRADAPTVRLDALYRRHAAWLVARIRSRFGGDAEDIAQEAWVRLAPIEKATDIRHPKALLLTIAGHIAIDRGRQAGRRAALLGHALPSPETEAAGQAEAVLIQQVILGLPQPLRDVFLLSRVKGLSNSSVRPGMSWRC